VGSKLAIVGTTVLMLTAATTAVETVRTGSANPLHWGSHVTQRVQTCKAQLPAGAHGIGQCVSPVAQQHGSAEQSEHAQATAHAPSPADPNHPAHPEPSRRPDAATASHASPQPTHPSQPANNCGGNGGGNGNGGGAQVPANGKP
jgi:hypothetical protein